MTVGEAGPRLFRHPHEATAAGIAFVTEDRKEDGLMLPAPVRTNTTLAALGRSFSRRGLVSGRAERRAAADAVSDLAIRCTDAEQPAGTLSGGNQQKVVVAKWLARDAEVFLFDEPTRGIDVAARGRIYELFDELVAAGKTLVIVSSDLEELFATCDRIAVMASGRLVETFARPDWSEEEIMRASFGRPREGGAPSTGPAEQSVVGMGAGS